MKGASLLSNSSKHYYFLTENLEGYGGRHALTAVVLGDAREVGLSFERDGVDCPVGGPDVVDHVTAS